MRKPDFFIIGAPKSGTTALYRYLGQHPEIFMPAIKEPHFFSVDLDPPQSIRDPHEYLSLFSAARTQKRVGEASATYLYSAVAAHRIRDHCDRASIIAMLRNPVDMIHALHGQRRFNGTEEIADFEEALAAEEDRRMGRRPARGAFFLYRDVARYSGQIRRYLDCFGKEHVHVILYDDFQRDTAGVYRETLGFLGVDPDFRARFRVVNPHREARSRIIQRWIKPYVRQTGPLGPLLHRGPLRSLGRVLLRLNSRIEPRAAMDEGLRSRLQREFAPEVKALGELLGRDLTHWIRR